MSSVKIHLVKSQQIPADLKKRLYALLPAAMQEEMDRFMFEADQNRFLLARLLVCRALASEQNPLDTLAGWKQSEYGRPFIPGLSAFNLSHSGSHIILAYADFDLGIDLEKVRQLDFDLFTNYMTEREWEEIGRWDDPLSRFFHYWTIKEAVMKAEGLGFHLPLEEISLSPSEAWVRGRKWHLRKLDLGAEYPCHLALEKDEPLELQIEDPAGWFA